MLQARLQDVSGEDVSDALLLSGQRLEAERALFQERMQSCMAQLSSKASEVGLAWLDPQQAVSATAARLWSWHGMRMIAWPYARLHDLLIALDRMQGCRAVLQGRP